MASTAPETLGPRGSGSVARPLEEFFDELAVANRDLDEADRALGAVVEAFRGHRRSPAGGGEQEDGTLGALDWQLQEILDLA